ncbi:MAG: HobA family DNA replication regulator [Campylobacterota bacterium]
MQQALIDWTRNYIRGTHPMSWMEERIFEWGPIATNCLQKVLEGKTILLLTDEDSKWLQEYIPKKINDPSLGRPLIPLYPLKQIYPNIDNIRNSDDIEVMNDMLSISFEGGYFIWYIGRSDHPYTRIAFRDDENFLWVFNDEIQSAFNLKSYDKDCDIKLLELFRLFNDSIDAALFGEF